VSFRSPPPPAGQGHGGSSLAGAGVAGTVGAALATTVLGSGGRRTALEPAVGVPAAEGAKTKQRVVAHQCRSLTDMDTKSFLACWLPADAYMSHECRLHDVSVHDRIKVYFFCLFLGHQFVCFMIAAN
jgi:hypothetical protein